MTSWGHRTACHKVWSRAAAAAAAVAGGGGASRQADAVVRQSPKPRLSWSVVGAKMVEPSYGTIFTQWRLLGVHRESRWFVAGDQCDHQPVAEGRLMGRWRALLSTRLRTVLRLQRTGVRCSRRHTAFRCDWRCSHIATNRSMLSPPQAPCRLQASLATSLRMFALDCANANWCGFPVPLCYSYRYVAPFLLAQGPVRNP